MRNTEKANEWLKQPHLQVRNCLDAADCRIASRQIFDYIENEMNGKMNQPLERRINALWSKRDRLMGLVGTLEQRKMRYLKALFGTGKSDETI